jgi:hypothetical protein
VAAGVILASVAVIVSAAGAALPGRSDADEGRATVEAELGFEG